MPETCPVCAAAGPGGRRAYDYGDHAQVIHAWEPADDVCPLLVWRSPCGLVCGGGRLVREAAP